jgi:hypothetical protein
MNTWYKLVGLAAASALFVYALSCRPSWSPDSTQVAFAYAMGKDVAAVAIHDLGSGETRRVIAFDQDLDIVYPQTLWMGDKLVVICIKEDGEILYLVAVDPATAAIREIRTVDLDKMKPSPTVPPVVDHEGNIWLSGNDDPHFDLIKIAPGARKVERIKRTKITCLAEGGGKIYMISEWDGKTSSRSMIKSLEKGLKCCSVGLFKPDREWLLTVTGQKEIPYHLAVSPDGLKASFFGLDEKGQGGIFFIQPPSFTRDGSSRIPLPGEIEAPGGLAFSADSRTCWFIYLPKNENNTAPMPVLVEIHPEEGVLRKVQLRFKGVDFEKNLTLALQPAVSPDGKKMAISTVCFEKDAPGRLLLVDLESLETRFIEPPALETK